MQRKSTAVWRGTGLEGQGALTTQSGVFNSQPYSFKTRFKSEDGKDGTNPEELIAAAHAGCFNMALSFMLTGAGHPPEELKTDASVKLGMKDGHFFIESIHLSLTGRVPGLSAARFQELAAQAKANCPVSQALSAVPISLEATLA